MYVYLRYSNKTKKFAFLICVSEQAHLLRNHEIKSFETNDTVVLVDDLIPDTKYEVTLTTKTDKSCINKRKVIFKTVEGE